MENCAGALRAFPSDAKEAVFHIGGPDDGYRLPVVQRYADCEVLVETAELAADNPVSSWVEIGLAAMELNTVCFTAYGGKIGGTTYCGGGNGVKISLRGAGRRMSDEGNAAAEA